jgi:hypothetical protein
MTATEPKTSHTPGPWTSHDNGDTTSYITARGGADIADTRSSVDEPANARLIAAAPDLLAACRSSLELSQHADGCGWFDIPTKELNGSEHSQAKQREKCNCHLKFCREAIAKATGN